MRLDTDTGDTPEARARRVRWLLGREDEAPKATPVVRPPQPVVAQKPAKPKRSRKSNRTAIIDGSPWAPTPKQQACRENWDNTRPDPEVWLTDAEVMATRRLAAAKASAALLGRMFT